MTSPEKLPIKLTAKPRRWPTPPSPGPWIAVPALLVGGVVALLLPAAPRPGLNVSLSGLTLALPLLVLLHREGRRRGRARPIGRAAGALAVVAVALPLVATVRATGWLSLACALAGLCLLLAVLLDLRRWDAVLAGPAMFCTAVVRSLPWAVRPLHQGEGPTVPKPVLAGSAVGSVLVITVGGLLASADPAYAQVLSWLVPDLDRTPLRALVLVVTALVFLGGAFGACSRRSWRRAEPGPARPAAEWLIPLVLVAVTIATFLAVEAGTLFGGLDVVTGDSTLTHAGRARQGFGQLCAVTLLVLALLAWAGSLAGRGGRQHRRWMGIAGGGLLTLTLLLAASALRRLALYQETYGWTVARLNAGAFESWLVVVLLAAGTAWVARRVDLLPRLVMGSAGAGLLLIALLSPDALVARLDVDRYLSTGRIDASYLHRLSDDAVPALQDLPDGARRCVLFGRQAESDPAVGWNYSRSRAARLLAERPAAAPLDQDCSFGNS